jgi:hypothetical protein
MNKLDNEIGLGDVRSFRAAEDADHCLEVAKVRERLAVSKQTAHSFLWRGSIKK